MSTIPPSNSPNSGVQEKTEDQPTLFFACYYIGYVLCFFAFLGIFVLLPLLTLQNWLLERQSQLSNAPLLGLAELWVFLPPIIVFIVFLYIFPLVYLLLFLGLSKLFGIPKQKVRKLLEKTTRKKNSTKKGITAPEADGDFERPETIVVEITDGYMRMEKTRNVNLGKKGVVARMFYTDI